MVCCPHSMDRPLTHAMMQWSDDNKYQMKIVATNDSWRWMRDTDAVQFKILLRNVRRVNLDIHIEQCDIISLPEDHFLSTALSSCQAIEFDSITQWLGPRVQVCTVWTVLIYDRRWT